MINFQELEKVAEFKNGELNWLEGRDINAVYVILVGDEYYIGSSHYTYLRIGQHLDKLLNNCHHSDKFQAKFNEVGEFEVYSLDRGIEKAKLQIVELEYIRKYQPSLNLKMPKIKKSRTIKNKREFVNYQANLEAIIVKGAKLGSMEFLPKEDLDEMDRLTEALKEYEAAYYPLPGHFSSLLIDVIYDKMEEKHINQKEMASLLKVSEARMSDILSGKRQINLKIARDLRDKLGISADFIMDCYCCK